MIQIHAYFRLIVCIEELIMYKMEPKTPFLSQQGGAKTIEKSKATELSKTNNYYMDAGITRKGDITTSSSDS